MSLSKSDAQLVQILDVLKLEVNKHGQITQQTLPSVCIKAMRLVERMKITGDLKGETVVNLIVLLLKDYSELEVIVSDVKELVQDLFDTKVIIKKKCCM
jgi:hypothetical protein